jgi:lipopolysaccharide heptosyltransferase I
LRILILKPSSLGDVVQALPVLRLLKRQWPASEVFWWLDASLAALLEGDPDLAGIYVFQRRRWRAPRYWGEFFHQIAAMRRQQFDWVIDLQSLARSALVAWLANGRQTIGLDDAREGARGFYDIVVPRPSPHTHAVDWYLEVLKPLGVSRDAEFVWLPDRPAVAAALRQRWGVEAHPWIALGPGARWANKRWPAEGFARLLALLHRQHPTWRFVILGSQEDRPLGEVIAAAGPEACLDLTGRTTLPEMVEWLRRCTLLVTNDTGPMHVAAALGRPILALFGPTDPRRTGPYGQSQRVVQRTDLPCVPCLEDRCDFAQPFACLRQLPVDQVVARAEALFADTDHAARLAQPPAAP